MGTTSEELKRLYSNLGGDDKDTAKTQSPVEVLKKIYEYLGGENPNAKNVQQTGDILNKFNEMDIKLCVDERFYPPIIDEVKGNPVTFSGSEAPLVRCDVDLKPQQDLHGYDRPWVGGAGKNKFDKTTYTFTSEKYVSLSTGNIGTNSSYACTESYIPCSDLAGQTITLNHIPGGAQPGMAFYDSNNEYINGGKGDAITVPSNAVYYRFTVPIEYASGDDVQIELGSTATAYESYSNICPISGYSSVGVESRGKNLCDKNDFNHTNTIVYKPMFVGDGTFTMSTNCPPTGGGQEYYRDIFFLPGNVDSGASSSTNGVIDSTPITCESIDGYVTVASRYNSVRNDPLDYDWQIEKGSVATAYEPHAGQTYTISLGDTYYSGQIDVVKGVLRATSQMEVFDGTATVSFGRASYDNWYYTISGNVIGNTGGTFPITNKYVGNAINNDNSDLGIYKLPGGQVRVRVGGTKPADTSAFLAELTAVPLQVLSPLETPLEIPLTPTEIFALQGINTMWTNADSLDVEYITDNWNIFHPTIETESTKRKSMNRNSTRNLVLRVPIEDVEPTEEEVEVKEDIPEPTKEESIVKKSVEEVKEDIPVKKSVEEDPVKEDTTVEEVVTDEQQSVRLS